MTDSTAEDVSPSGEATKATLAKLSMGVIGFVGNIYFVNILGEARYGAFLLLLVVTQYLGRPVAGLNKAVTKRASEAGTSFAQSIGLMGVAAVGWFLIVAAGVLLARDLLVDYTGLELAVPLLLAYFTSELLYGVFVPIVQARGQIGFSFGMDALRSYVEIPVQFVLLTVGFGVPGMIAGLVAANLVVTPLVVRKIGVRPKVPSSDLVSSVASYARFSVPNSLVGTAYGRFDTFLLGAVAAQSVVGNYGAAARLTLPATYVATAVAGTVFVRVSDKESRGSDSGTDISNALAFASIIAVPIAFGAAVVGDPLTGVLYPRFDSLATGPVAGFLPAQYKLVALFLVAIGVQRIVESQTRVSLDVIEGLDRPKQSFKLSLLALGVNVPLGLLFIYWIGPVGVVVATIVAEIARYVGSSVLIHRELPDTSVLTDTFLKQLGAGAGMAVAVAAVDRVVDATTIPGLAILLATGAVVYGGILVVVSERVRATTREVSAMTLDRLERAL